MNGTFKERSTHGYFTVPEALSKDESSAGFYGGSSPYRAFSQHVQRRVKLHQQLKETGTMADIRTTLTFVLASLPPFNLQP